MLQNLSIQNYALIEKLDIEFNKGFSIITGETGAGKSILLGALSLLVGQRADASVLLDKTRKCVVEGAFDITDYQLNDFFIQNEIDYNNQTIIRREILDNGRSRAFVNDCPVNLNIIKELGDRLIDIHSQHQNLYVNDFQFQIKLIDALARNNSLLDDYKSSYKKHNQLEKALADLTEKAKNGQAELDFLQHQYNELESAKIKAGEQLALEDELKILSHAEEIKTYLSYAASIMSAEETGIVVQLRDTLSHLNKIKNIYPKAAELSQRIDSVYIELKDISNETENNAESVELDPQRLETVKTRLDLLYLLCQKHRKTNANELIELCAELGTKVQAIVSFDEELHQLSSALNTEKQLLTSLATQLTKKRKSVIPSVEGQIMELLKQLGMPNAQFSVKLEDAGSFNSLGSDKITFLFTANKAIEMQDVAKVASGGEISRLMLALKSVVSASLAMPTIIFDEIDTGVSGDIAEKMANIMKQMSSGIQVISITHLPQVAAKGQYHYWVYKIHGENATNSHIRQLNAEERITEIAKMLSGEQLSEAALNNAKVLLNL